MIAALAFAWFVLAAAAAGYARVAGTPPPPRRPPLYLVDDRPADDPRSPVSHRTLTRINNDHPHGA